MRARKSIYGSSDLGGAMAHLHRAAPGAVQGRDAIANQIRESGIPMPAASRPAEPGRAVFTYASLEPVAVWF